MSPDRLICRAGRSFSAFSTLAPCDTASAMWFRVSFLGWPSFGSSGAIDGNFWNFGKPIDKTRPRVYNLHINRWKRRVATVSYHREPPTVGVRYRELWWMGFWGRTEITVGSDGRLPLSAQRIAEDIGMCVRRLCLESGGTAINIRPERKYISFGAFCFFGFFENHFSYSHLPYPCMAGVWITSCFIKKTKNFTFYQKTVSNIYILSK